MCYVFFIIVIWRGISRAHLQCKNRIRYADTPFVSVLIATHNECENVLKCLDALLNQDYPRLQFEVIVVDDASTDCTHNVLQKFTTNSIISVVQNSSRKKYKSSKKSALEMAVQYSKGDILLFTDADCVPPSTWITSIVRQFDSSTGLVAGFSPQQSEKAGLNEILKIDAAATAVVSAATIGFSRGITCAGRNLGYRKQAWLDVGGFAALPDSLSGDDDFILQAISNHPEWDVKYLFGAQTIVPAKGPESISRFLKQKQRHISAGQFYPLTAQIGFALFHAINLLMWLISIWTVFFQPLCLIFLMLKCLFDFLIVRRFFVQFNLKINLKTFCLWEILFVYYNTISGPVGFLKKLEW